MTRLPRTGALLHRVGLRRVAVRADAGAGLTVGVASVPDGMAASVLAGVNPVHGLYAAMTGSIVGGLAARTQLMLVTTTSAAALAGGEALSVFRETSEPRRLRSSLSSWAGFSSPPASFASAGSPLPCRTP